MRICTICARGGSKGIPGKNLFPLLGKPLVAHSVRQALDSGLFDIVAVSSDSDAILEAAAAEGPVHAIRRLAELAGESWRPRLLSCSRRRHAWSGRRSRFATMVDPGTNSS